MSRQTTQPRQPSTVRDGAALIVVAGVAVLVSWAITTRALIGLISLSDADSRLGGMWAVIATAFVLHGSLNNSLMATRNRMFATAVSLVLCLVYLLLFSFNPLGLAVVISAGALVGLLSHQRQDFATISITTTVVLVVASLGPADTAWREPLYRFGDTLVGAIVGVAASYLLQTLRSA